MRSIVISHKSTNKKSASITRKWSQSMSRTAVGWGQRRMWRQMSPFTALPHSCLNPNTSSSPTKIGNDVQINVFGNGFLLETSVSRIGFLRILNLCWIFYILAKGTYELQDGDRTPTNEMQGFHNATTTSTLPRLLKNKPIAKIMGGDRNSVAPPNCASQEHSAQPYGGTAADGYKSLPRDIGRKSSVPEYNGAPAYVGMETTMELPNYLSSTRIRHRRRRGEELLQEKHLRSAEHLPRE